MHSYNVAITRYQQQPEKTTLALLFFSNKVIKGVNFTTFLAFYVILKKNPNLPKVSNRPITKSNSFEFDIALPVYLFLSLSLKRYIHLHWFCFFKTFPTKMRILTELAASEYDYSFSKGPILFPPLYRQIYEELFQVHVPWSIVPKKSFQYYPTYKPTC